jgi:hypothetical protein
LYCAASADYLPEIGKGQEWEIRSTTAAYKEIAARVREKSRKQSSFCLRTQQAMRTIFISPRVRKRAAILAGSAQSRWK